MRRFHSLHPWTFGTGRGCLASWSTSGWVSRHARQAGSVTVSVTQDGRTLTVEITDDAPPTPPRYPRRAGYGLIGMRERVETLGGTLSAGPRTGTGWSVHATLPLPTREPR